MTATKNNSGLTVFGPQEVMGLLWRKSSKSLSIEEMRWFAEGASDFLPMQARHMERVLTGIGCMVALDGTSDGLKTGSFQDSDEVSNLMFLLANQMSMLAGMAEIASDANYSVMQALEGGTKP